MDTKTTVQYDPSAQVIILALNGKTETIPVKDIWGNGQKLVSCRRNGAAKHTRGSKVYPVYITFLKDANGGYTLQTQYSAVGRPTTLVGWLKDQPPESISKRKP